jgi:hypothetical protein
MENVETDIIPPHGFMAKHSPLWPLAPLPTDEGRVASATSNPPPEPGHPDTLKPRPERVDEQRARGERGEREDEVSPQGVKTQAEMLQNQKLSKNYDQRPNRVGSREDYEAMFGPGGPGPSSEEVDRWEPKPPKVLMEDPNVVPLELHAQIQLYATNE